MTHRPDSVCALEGGMVWGQEIPAAYKMAGGARWGQGESLSAVALATGQLPQGHPATFQGLALL